MSKDNDLLRRRYRRSQELLTRACQVMPLGSQTFSKSSKQYPAQVSPHFITQGRGSHVWDVDGNEYVDFISSLGAINLGHADPDVTAAVQAQLQAGVIFSLPHVLEVDVAQKMRDVVPCAEMTRFGKNGSDVTTAAIRLARAYTGRDHVLVCGYHGWQDWYIGSTERSLGVPKAVRELTHPFEFNNIESAHRLLREHSDNVAAVILEPMSTAAPKPGYLEELQALTHRSGAIFILDEMITGFRHAAGGAQARFGLTPDLATFGKAMANGFPVSALCGKAQIMQQLELVFFSLTYGGETLSLAAASATIRKIQEQPVIDALYRQGGKVLSGVEQLINKHAIGHIVSICGHPTLSFLVFADTARYSQWDVKTLYMQEIFARGVLSFGVHMMNYSHSDDDVTHLLNVYDEVFALIKQAVDHGAMSKLLRTTPLAPLARIR